jgi:hypothetical protein
MGEANTVLISRTGTVPLTIAALGNTLTSIPPQFRKNPPKPGLAKIPCFLQYLTH